MPVFHNDLEIDYEIDYTFQSITFSVVLHLWHLSKIIRKKTERAKLLPTSSRF